MHGRLNSTVRLAAAFFLIALAAASSAHAERLAVTVDIANVRGGPGTDHDVIWQVEKYYPVEILKKDGHWRQFKDFEGDIGWLHDSLLGNVETVITKNPRCNVRSGPGTSNDVLFTVDPGIPFKVIGKKGVWLQVEHMDGDTGWIHKSLVW